MSLRIERFELRAFGPFTGTVLELDREGMHLICGPNEVGKSTSQRAIGDFLFGIPPRSTDNHVHSYVNMRLAALLVDGDGQRHDLVRRKGSRQTLLAPNEEPLDEGMLEAMLGGMTRGVFESMFSITHESLVVGGKALLAADGNVGESLFSASLGASSLHELRLELESEAQDLFRPRGTTGAIPRARVELDAVRTRLREATLRAGAYAELERGLRDAEKERAAAEERLRAARTEQHARERLRAVIPQLAQRVQVKEELEALADTPALPGDALERRVLAEQRLAMDRRGVEEAQARIEELKKRIDEVEPDAALLERELAIKDLHGRLAGVREGAEDLERQGVELQSVEALAKRALEKVRPDLKLEAASELALSGPQVAKVDAALESHTSICALLRQAEQAAEEAEDRAAELTAELEGFEQPLETSALEAAIADAQAEGQVEQRTRDAEAELANALDALEDSLRRLSPQVEVEELRRLCPPSAIAVDQFAREREELDARARETAERADRLQEARNEFEEELARLQLTTDVPTVEDLGAARSTRDEEWRRLRKKLDGAKEEESSPDVFERHLGQADDLADRLRVEADSVARRAQLTATERRLEADAESLAAGREELDADRQAHERRWNEAWNGTGIAAGTPREMLEWLRVREDTLERVEAVARRRRRIETERGVRDKHVEVLRTQLAQPAEEGSEEPTLTGLLEVARGRLAEAGAARDLYERLERELRMAKARAEAQHKKAREQRAALEEWTGEWAQLLTANGWPQEVGPDSARQTLNDIGELAKHLQEVTQMRTRASAVRERLEAFESDAAKLVGELAPELADRPLNDAVAELARRLEEALRVRSARQALEEGLVTASKGLETVEQSRGRAELELEALVELAGVEKVESLPEVERRSIRAGELRVRLPELEAQIAEVGQASLRELIERTEGLDIDALGAQRVEAEEEITGLESKLHQLDVRIGELGAEQRKMESLDGAAGTAEELEQQVAALRALTERYLRLHLAGWALSRAIDSYRREHKGPLLKRADELFPELTCGSFQALEVGFDENDEPILVGVRSNGRRAPVQVMSTGTREQLYLALRLASLERHIAAHGPMPVILDDVVLHSDPKRKTAILSALAELGRRTQVIAFTHDPQVVALAQSALDADVLTIHELGGNQITGALQRRIETAAVHPVESMTLV